MTEDEQKLVDAVLELMHRFDASGLDSAENLKKLKLKDIHANGSWYGSISLEDFSAASYIHMEAGLRGKMYNFS
ncbi:hypothetical protein Q0M94_08785 [Deinococcus radiomollis]|uniref:hypothetical protein n=1 Tax=Deinococcus radiomollis TaxID=468916 RepID=UPI00389266AA